MSGSLPVAARVAMTVPAGTARTLACRLDDWPLLLLDLDADRLWVNDLRASCSYSHVACLRDSIRANEAVSCEAGADDDSTLIIVGTLLIAVHVDPTEATFAEVQAIQWGPAASARGTLLDCRVRYRQLPAADAPACSLSSARR